MNKLTRIKSLFLAVVMIVCVSGTTVFASESSIETTSSPQQETICEFDITPEMVNEDGSVIIPRSTIDQSFNMTTSHTGSTRTYYGNAIRFGVIITDTNGNAVDNIVAIRLYHSSGRLISEDQVWCNGVQNNREVAISYGSSYYFQYLLAYGTTRTLRVRMIITPV